MYVAEATESELALAARTLEYIEFIDYAYAYYLRRERESEMYTYIHIYIYIYMHVSECLSVRRIETMSAKGDRTWEHVYDCISSELIM